MIDAFIKLVGYLTGFAGLLASVYFGLENRRLNRLQNRFTWPDIERACRQIGSTMKSRRRGAPDLVLCFEGPSAVIANLAIAIHGLQVPVLMISLRSRKSQKPYMTESLDQFEVLTSSKWVLSVPKAVLSFSGKKVWIVEDAIVTGDSLGLLKRHLFAQGFREEDVFTTTVICTDVARTSDKGADETYFHVDSSGFWFPWGKGA
jgi:hypoxanthine phosphoribosyltransferase